MLILITLTFSVSPMCPVRYCDSPVRFSAVFSQSKNKYHKKEVFTYLALGAFSHVLVSLRWSSTQNFRYLLFFIHKASSNTDHNIICMFLKRKTISKPEKSSLATPIRVKPRFNPEQIMVFSWLTLLSAISIVLFYLIILIYA